MSITKNIASIRMDHYSPFKKHEMWNELRYVRFKKKETTGNKWFQVQKMCIKFALNEKK